jgi:protein O-mannosyl-transferase
VSIVDHRHAHQAAGGAVSEKKIVLGIAVLLAISVFLVFGRTIQYEFVDYDDGLYFFSNPQVLSGLTPDGIAWAFRTTDATNWHPLTWLSLMLDVSWFGPGPAGPHLTNTLLHAANTVLLFLLLTRLTGAIWRSALVAALFALHPLHVESVAWVSERKDVLSGLFFMLTLLMYERYVRRVDPDRRAGFQWLRSRNYWLTILLCALGLMSKPMLVTLPFVMLLLDWWPMQRVADAGRTRILHLTLEKAPFLALSVVSSIATLIAQRDVVQPLAQVSFGIRLVNAVVSYGRYLFKMIWPGNLAIPYLHPGYGSLWKFLLCTSVILAATVVFWRWRRQYPFFIVGWLWYLGMMVPVIGLVQVGIQSMADRYTYLPLIGVFIGLAWGAAEVCGRFRVPKTVIRAAAVLIVCACALRSVAQLRYWRNTATLFLHTIDVMGDNELAQYNLGCYYFRRSEFADAIRYYREAIRIKPDYDDALNNLGTALAANGQLDEAVIQIRAAIRCNPRKSDAQYNLGNVFVMQRRFDEAIPCYTEALRLTPDYAEAHNNLANLFAMQGRTNEAIAHYQQVLRVKPNHEQSQRQLRALGVPVP